MQYLCLIEQFPADHVLHFIEGCCLASSSRPLADEEKAGKRSLYLNFYNWWRLFSFYFAFYFFITGVTRYNGHALLVVLMDEV